MRSASCTTARQPGREWRRNLGLRRRSFELRQEKQADRQQGLVSSWRRWREGWSRRGRLLVSRRIASKLRWRSQKQAEGKLCYIPPTTECVLLFGPSSCVAFSLPHILQLLLMISACPGCCLGFLQMVRSQSKLRQVEEPEPASWAFPTWPLFCPKQLSIHQSLPFSVSLSPTFVSLVYISFVSNVSLNPNQHLRPFLLGLNCPQQLSILCSPIYSVLALSLTIILLSRWFTFLSN